MALPSNQDDLYYPPGSLIDERTYNRLYGANRLYGRLQGLPDLAVTTKPKQKKSNLKLLLLEI